MEFRDMTVKECPADRGKAGRVPGRINEKRRGSVMR